MSTTGRTATIGTFDGVHLGHRALIDKVRSLFGGSRPLVISFRTSPAAIIAGRTPAMLCSLAERRRELEALGTDVVFLDFEDVRHLGAAAFLRNLAGKGVGKLVMGFNNRIGSDRLDAAGADALDILPVVNAGIFADGGSICSSRIREALAEGSVEAAAKMLGRPYKLTGTVVSGRHLGRELGYRTANIEPAAAECCIVPAEGVYAAYATVDGLVHAAMVNIGRRPSVETDGNRTIEAHLIDFSGDIYGKELTLAFVRRLRAERHFAGPGELAAQLARDKNMTIKILTDI